ncbi:hypothetical protein FM103_06435 [Corynebacterium xerosis]|nr:hypothetical protein FM103_06435 [Corynebacterium xerosis]
MGWRGFCRGGRHVFSFRLGDWDREPASHREESDVPTWALQGRTGLLHCNGGTGFGLSDDARMGPSGRRTVVVHTP